MMVGPLDRDKGMQCKYIFNDKSKSEDADFVGFDGTYLEGKKQIISFHAMLFDKFVRGIRLVGKVKHIRFPSPSVAIVIGISGTIERGHTNINPERNSIHTIVAVKDDHLWKFTSFQNTRAQYLGNPEKMETLTNELEQLIQPGGKKHVP